MQRLRCRTCDARFIQKFGFCPTCWAAAKFGFGIGTVLAATVSAIVGIVAWIGGFR